MYELTSWRHAFKLDPDKEISEEALERICESGTDVIIVGGSDNVTLEGVLSLLSRVRRFLVPCVLEVSTTDSVVPGFDSYFIPMVLNSRNTRYITELHHQALVEYGDIMNWDEIYAEGYCILNGEAKAAELTDANVHLTADDVIAYARMAQNLYHLPVFYLEYSGTYGDPVLVEKVKKELRTTRLFYGGGITSKEQAAEMAAFADTVIVGNIIYDDLEAALTTVAAVKDLQQ